MPDADLFPHDERVLARLIGTPAVYVPSAQGKRPVHGLTAAETREAANHIAQQAASLRRMAAHLGRLARLRETVSAGEATQLT